MRKKRGLALILAAALALTAAGCSSTTQATDGAGDTTAAAQTDAQQTETAGENAVNHYTAGTYEASTSGHNGTVTIRTTFSEDAITDIEVVTSYESQGVSDKALYTELPESIIENQSLAVDTIAGATISSNAMLRAVSDCVEQAGGDPALLQVEPEKAEPQDITLTADVVIIGGGGAGLSAAVSATDNGASVIIVEKEGYVGGNTMVSGGIYNCPDPEMQQQVEMTDGVAALIEDALAEEPVSEEHAALQAAVQQEWDEYKASGATYLFDSVNWYTLQTWNGGDKVGDLELISTMTSHAYETLQWLVSMGYEYKPDIVQGAGSLYQRTHSSVEHAGIGFINCFTETLADRDAQIFYNTPASEIIMENGEATGIRAEDRDGNTYTIYANQGVILATGGFAGNLEMVQEYNTSGKWPDLSQLKSTNLPGMTGDGIEMAVAAGAALRDMDQIQLLQTTSPKTGNCTFGYVAPLEAAGYLFFNSEGERFIGEDGRRDDISLAALDQTDALFYMVESGDVITDPENTYDLSGVPLTELIKSGDVIVGDTLEELCQQVGWDYETVQAQIDQYNANVDSNAVSDEYGRALFSVKQENGPWYAIPRTPSVHHTMGGVVINTNAQVLNEEGKVIPGLYAAGEVTGGIHGGNRLGGNAIVDCLVFGQIAGENCAVYGKEEVPAAE